MSIDPLVVPEQDCVISNGVLVQEMAHALYHSAQTRASYARTRLFGSSFTVCETHRKLRVWARFACERPSMIGKDLI